MLKPEEPRPEEPKPEEPKREEPKPESGVALNAEARPEPECPPKQAEHPQKSLKEFVPGSVAQSSEHNNPQMSAGRVRELAALVAEAKAAAKAGVRKTAFGKGKAEPKAKAKAATGKKEEVKRQKDLPEDEEEENTLESEEPLSSEYLPSETSEEEGDGAKGPKKPKD